MNENKVGERDIMRGLRGASGHEVTLGGVRAQLRALGLHIVDAKDKAVLDAMGRIPESTLRAWIKRSFLTVLNLAELELTRRETK